MPPLMVREVLHHQPCLPFLIKGRCHEAPEGIRSSEAEQTIPQSAYGCQLPLHKGAMVWGRYGGAPPVSVLYNFSAESR